MLLCRLRHAAALGRAAAGMFLVHRGVQCAGGQCNNLDSSCVDAVGCHWKCRARSALECWSSIRRCTIAAHPDGWNNLKSC